MMTTPGAPPGTGLSHACMLGCRTCSGPGGCNQGRNRSGQSYAILLGDLKTKPRIIVSISVSTMIVKIVSKVDD